MNLFLLKILAHVLLLLDSGSHTNCCYEPLHRKHVVVVLLFADADNASWELSRWSQTEIVDWWQCCVQRNCHGWGLFVRPMVSTFISTVANVVVEQGVADPGAMAGKPIEQ